MKFVLAQSIVEVGQTVQSLAVSAAFVVGGVVAAGLVIFGIIWGVRRAKMGLCAASDDVPQSPPSNFPLDEPIEYDYSNEPGVRRNGYSNSGF